MRKLITTLFFTILAVTMLSMTVSATATPPNTVEVDKSSNTMTFKTDLVLSNKGITAPDVDFTYTVSTGDIMGTTVVEEFDKPTVTTTAFDATTDFVDPEATIRVLSKNVTLTFDMTNFTTTGVYKYKVEANANTTPGIRMDLNQIRYIFVYVSQDLTTNKYKIENVVMTTGDYGDNEVTHVGKDKVFGDINNKSEGFVNGYGMAPNQDPNPTPSEPEQNDPYDGLMISSHVSGNMADRSKIFTINLIAENVPTDTIFSVSNNNQPEYIKWDGSKFVKVTYENGAWTVGDDLTISQDHADSYYIYSLIEGMVFTSTMTEEENYTIAYDIDDSYSYTEGNVASNTIEHEDYVTYNQISYKATYELAIPDTGVVLEFLPFVLMVLLAAALITFRFFVVAKKSKR